MKIRIKFAKEGAMKFIGHLDIMRYFQRAIRRAGIDVAYSEGFSPHMIMSFANPLGVGLTSEAEYFDLVIRSEYSSQELTNRLNAVMVEGMQVLNVVQVPEEKASKAMSLVAAADYVVRFRYPDTLPENWKDSFAEFMEQPSITVVKKTKKGEKEMDLRPLVYDWRFEGDGIFLQVSSGSSDNLRPELVVEAFAKSYDLPLNEFSLLIHRKEVYADLGENAKHDFCPLDALGKTIA